MTDTTETTATPDPRAIARAVLLEVADEPDQVGDFATCQELEDHITDFRFAANIRGYEGWQWSVTLYHDEEIDSWTVDESSLVPTEDALMPPKWIPWKDRLEPTDLAPTDSIGTDPDDERIEDGEVEESSLEDVNDAVETFRLTRRHVLTSLGRAQAAKRWYEGPRGPKALSTKTAEGNLCSTCGFFVPLAGELDRMFGVCANKWSPDDGRVVSLDHGCGEHSEIEPPEPSQLWVQSKPAFDDLHIDVVANRPRKQEPTREDDADDETDEPVGGDGETQQGEVLAEEGAAATEAAEGAEATADAARAEDAGADGVRDIDLDEADDLDAGDIDDTDDIDSDEATEEDIIANTEVDDDDDDEEDDIEPEDADTTEEVAPELEAVVDLIEKLRLAKADAEAESDDDDEDEDAIDEPEESGEVEEADDDEPEADDELDDTDTADDTEPDESESDESDATDDADEAAPTDESDANEQ